jgi:hypothetical protein
MEQEREQQQQQQSSNNFSRRWPAGQQQQQQECGLLKSVCFATLPVSVPVLQRARRTKRSFWPWLLTLALVACAWFKLVTLSR